MENEKGTETGIETIKPKTQTQQVIEYLTENKIDKLTIKQMWNQFPNIKPNTMSTLISRDLKRKGLVTPTDVRKRPVIYAFDPEGMPLPKPILSPALKSRPAPNSIKKIEPDSYDSYVKIGRAIEQLLEDKNQSIMTLEARIKGFKRQLLDCEATVQERDRHIIEQGKKIHELSEKIRNKTGGAIKLDELQDLVNA